MRLARLYASKPNIRLPCIGVATIGTLRKIRKTPPQYSGLILWIFRLRTWWIALKSSSLSFGQKAMIGKGRILTWLCNNGYCVFVAYSWRVEYRIFWEYPILSPSVFMYSFIHFSYNEIYNIYILLVFIRFIRFRASDKTPKRRKC